jgi:hypothetical protein
MEKTNVQRGTQTFRSAAREEQKGTERDIETNRNTDRKKEGGRETD